jgi:hypothetical protein
MSILRSVNASKELEVCWQFLQVIYNLKIKKKRKKKQTAVASIIQKKKEEGGIGLTALHK